MSWLRWPRCWSGRAAASAQQVTGLTATQDYGFTTLKWSPVAGATDYQIERAPVAADGDGRHGAIVGLWQPQRTITPNAPTFAESGLQARRPLPVARARAAGHHEPAGPYSAPVAGTTHGPLGPAGAAGRPTRGTRSGRPGRVRGHRTRPRPRRPTSPPAGRRERPHAGRRARAHAPEPAGEPVHHRLPDAAGHRRRRSRTAPSVAINCNVHGNEASGRESCFTMARQLALSHRPGDHRHAEPDDGADRAVDQRRRPRAQPARQHAPARTSTATTR